MDGNDGGAGAARGATAITRLFDSARERPVLKDGTDHRKRLEQYLGYCFTFLKRDTPHVFDVADAAQVAAFVAFKVAKASTKLHLQATISTFLHAVRFLRCERPEWSGAEHRAHLRALGRWLEQLHAQISSGYVEAVGSGARRGDPQLLEQQGRWTSAAQLMGIIDSKRVQALAAMRAGGADAALIVQDALIAMLAFGYLGSVRPSVMASLRGPWAGTGCHRPSCQHPHACQGNRVWREPGGAWMMEVVHQKTDGAAGRGGALRVRLPGDFSPLLDFHCAADGGHDTLLGLAGGDEGCPWLLVHPSRGGMFAVGELSTRFIACQPEGCAVSIQMARSIFATAARDGALPAEHEQGAATLMGNSSAAWDATYDRARRGRGAQAAADAMAAMRARLLHPAAPAPVQQPAGLLQDSEESSWASSACTSSGGESGSSSGGDSSGSGGGGVALERESGSAEPGSTCSSGPSHSDGRNGTADDSMDDAWGGSLDALSSGSAGGSWGQGGPAVGAACWPQGAARPWGGLPQLDPEAWESE